MIKSPRLIAVFICILFLSGCSKPIVENIEKEIIKETIPDPIVSENPEEKITTISSPDLNTEEGIKQYLLGEWVGGIDYLSNVVCTMDIDRDLNINLVFQDSFTNESKGDYTGKIILERKYARRDEAPDLIRIELKDKVYPVGDYFFLHRTIYDGKRATSLFFAGNGNSIFSKIEDTVDQDGIIEEVIFEKVTGEKSVLNTCKNQEFYAVFFGHGFKYESVWLDEVEWTPPEEDDYATIYPRPMTIYENDNPESVLYNIAPGIDIDIIGDNMFKGQVYFVKTDGNGDILDIISADYKKYIEDTVIAIIMQLGEVKESMKMGMSILFTGETSNIDGEEFYDVALGTDHPESFVREIHYAVNIETEQIYKLDILNDIWEDVSDN